MNVSYQLNRSKQFIYLLITLILLSILTIGGCNDNSSNNNGDIDAPQTNCVTTATVPCTGISEGPNNTVICDSLGTIVCAVDLNAVISQADPDGLLGINGDTVMWMEAWGANGGNTVVGTDGAAGGYAVTTTTVNDLEAKNSGSSFIFFFTGTPGLEPDERCGGGGGVATIVTTEDLALNPTSNPTQSAPPVLLVAGGGGGGASGNKAGLCETSTQHQAGAGGEAYATMQADGQGQGFPSAAPGADPDAIGGNQNGMGKGGNSSGVGGETDPTKGSDGYGGLGGVGGTGPVCEGFGSNGFSNTLVELSMTTGLGGNGGSARGSCAAGGGAGGGGYGGGGAGESGDESREVIAGAGGGSFAIQSTKSSRKAPTTKQFNPCGANGCVRITFAP